MRSGQEPQTCGSVFSTTLQTQRDNWQHSSLSICGVPPANVPPSLPPSPHPLLHTHLHLRPKSQSTHVPLFAALLAVRGPLVWPTVAGISQSHPWCPPCPLGPSSTPPHQLLLGRDRAQVCSCISARLYLKKHLSIFISEDADRDFGAPDGRSCRCGAICKIHTDVSLQCSTLTHP